SMVFPFLGRILTRRRGRDPPVIPVLHGSLLCHPWAWLAAGGRGTGGEAYPVGQLGGTVSEARAGGRGVRVGQHDRWAGIAGAGSRSGRGRRGGALVLADAGTISLRPGRGCRRPGTAQRPPASRPGTA